MTDHAKDEAAQRLQNHLVQAEAARHASGTGGGLEGMLARISAETTTDAQHRRAAAPDKPSPVTAPSPTPRPLHVLVELAIAELQRPVRGPEAIALAHELQDALTKR